MSKKRPPNRILFIALFPIVYITLLYLCNIFSLHSSLFLALYGFFYYLNPTPWLAAPSSELPFTWLHVLGGISFWTFIGCFIALILYKDRN